MVILICGSRDWEDENVILERMKQIPSGSTIIHGGCKGADEIAGKIAEQLGFNVKIFCADWKTHGKAAGPIRNQKMLDEGKPDLVIAFHENIDSSKGTKDMLKRAKRANVQAEIIGL